MTLPLPIIIILCLWGAVFLFQYIGNRAQREWLLFPFMLSIAVAIIGTVVTLVTWVVYWAVNGPNG